MGQTLQYKGYDGSVLYSAEDRLLHGRILGIRDMVSFEGTDVKSLEKNFKVAADEAFSFCEPEGRTQDAPFKASFSVGRTQNLHQRAALYAEVHDLKLNAVVQQPLKV